MICTVNIDIQQSVNVCMFFLQMYQMEKIRHAGPTCLKIPRENTVCVYICSRARTCVSVCACSQTGIDIVHYSL